MKKIGITGSLASGKTTASKILAERRGPLFSADKGKKDYIIIVISKNLFQKYLKLREVQTSKKK